MGLVVVRHLVRVTKSDVNGGCRESVLGERLLISPSDHACIYAPMRFLVLQDTCVGHVPIACVSGIRNETARALISGS